MPTKPIANPDQEQRWNKLIDQIEGPIRELREVMRRDGYFLEIETTKDGSFDFCYTKLKRRKV